MRRVSPKFPPTTWRMRAYISPGDSVAARRVILRLYQDISPERLEQSWTSVETVRVERVTRFGILISSSFHRGMASKTYWWFARNREV